MEDLSFWMLLGLMAAGFLAAVIDSVVGGGGLVSLPALMLAGLPPGMVLGTNKVAAVMSSSASTYSFVRSGKVKFSLVKYLLPFSFVGSIIGAYVVQRVPPEALRPLVTALLVLVAIYTLFRKNWGQSAKVVPMTRRMWAAAGLAALLMGFYDGFFGPGTGSFLLFAFLLLGFDFVGAAGNAKILNFASNAAAVLVFVWLGSVNYFVALPMGLAMVGGALVGTRLAINNGAKYVRPLFICITFLMIGRQIWLLLTR